MSAPTRRSTRLIARDEIGPSGVTEVESPHGTLAVGIAHGRPFATSNVCRHQLAKLGRGLVTEDGCLQCPWHRAWFNVADGEMVRGPQGRVFGFGPYSKGIQLWANDVWRLKRYEVEERDGVIYLLD